MESVDAKIGGIYMTSPMFESLEGRLLLSTVNWPSAPFPSNSVRARIYVNQFGNAVLNRQATAGVFDGYDLAFDDAGPLRVKVIGVPSNLAFYYSSGRPTAVHVGGHVGLVSAQVPPDKQMQYIGVRPRASGTYRLQVNGPVPWFSPTIAIPKAVNAGASRNTSISSDNDYDFYHFTVPRSGNWLVKAIPDSSLDVTMNVFDVHGNPVGGSYTQTINNAGRGAPEQWLGVGLLAGARYSVRVDGFAGTLGRYLVSVSLANGPNAAISATSAPAGHGNGTGQFKVVRSENSAKPLTVGHAISSTATLGVDDAQLSGSVTIPANQLWAPIVVNPLPTAGNDKPVVLTLLPADGFSLHPQSEAVVSIRQGA
jgi:hypothetical protein